MRNRVIFLSLVIALVLCGTVSGGGQRAGSSATGSAPAVSFNATGFPIVNQQVTLRILTPNSAANPPDFNDLLIMQKVEAKTNVRIDWVMAGAGFNEKKALMLATGDLPDIINRSVTAAELIRYGGNGTFIPMQNLIDQYGVNTKKLFSEISGLRAFLTAPDGNIYGVPRVNAAPWTAANGIGIINKTWLDSLGRPMPTTVEEFHQTLLAFRSINPAGGGRVIPLSFAKYSTGGATTLADVTGFSYLMASFGVPLNTEYMDVVNGRVVNIATTDGFKEGIRYLSRLFADGLIDPEGFTMGRNQLNAKISQTPFTVGYLQGWDIPDEFSTPEAVDNYVFMPLLRGPNGRTPVFYEVPLYGITRGSGVITSACRHPEVAMRWIDNILDTITSIEVCEGPIDVRVMDMKNGTFDIAPPPPGKNATQWKDENALGGSGFFAITAHTFEHVLRFPTTDNKVAFMNSNLFRYSDKEAFPPVYYTAEEADEVALLRTDIISFIERRASEWIMNGRIDAEWDAYMRELESMGNSKLLSINQAAYNRFIR